MPIHKVFVVKNYVIDQYIDHDENFWNLLSASVSYIYMVMSPKVRIVLTKETESLRISLLHFLSIFDINVSCV